MGPVPVGTDIKSHERQLAQLLGAETAASTDSFTVQAVLDQDSLAYLPSEDTPLAIWDWQRRQAEQLPPYQRKDLAEAVRVLQWLEAHDPRRRDAIKKRFLVQLQSSSNEIKRELAEHGAKYTRDWRVHAIWPQSGPDNTYYFADVRYMIHNLDVDFDIMTPGLHRHRPVRERWIPAEPVAVLLLRLNWRDSRIHYDLPPAKQSGLERVLEGVKTISEFVLLVTGIADAILIARLLGVLAGAGTRALSAGLVRSLALRRGAREAAAGLAGRAETAGLRMLPELGRATGDTARLTTRAIGPAERGLAPGRSALGDPLTADRAILARRPVFQKPTVTGDPTLEAGYGKTNKYGDITYSTQGSATDIALVRNHEMVHSFLSPKLALLREFRADLRMAAYQRSSLLKYIEEALAETYAQVRVHGLRGLPTGIRFPIANGYVELSAVLKEAAIGTAIGTVAIGADVYVAYIVTDRDAAQPFTPPTPARSPTEPPLRSPVDRR